MTGYLYNPGDRVELVTSGTDPEAIPPGTQGVVTGVEPLSGAGPWLRVDVTWDDGRRSMLAVPPYRLRVLGGV